MSVFSRILGTLMFKKDVIEEIEKSSGLTIESMVLILIAFICGVIADYVIRLATSTPSSSFISFFITSLITQMVLTLSWFFVAAIIGNACGGETSFLEIVRCMGYAYIISAFRLIPAVILYVYIGNVQLVLLAGLLTLLIWIWALINTVYVLSIALDKGILYAVIIGILAIIIAFIVWSVALILVPIFLP